MIYRSALIEDYYMTGNLPEIDALLDWRNELIRMQKECPNKDYYNIEIAATDFLLNMAVDEKP
jgi:hypothetical protein